MKKLYFLTLGLMMTTFAFAQIQNNATEFFNEDFSNGVPPSGWSIDNQQSQWSQASSENAGGSAPEAQLTWINGTHTTRLISPETDLTGVDQVIFSFKHFLNDYSGSGYSIGVATRSGGGDWTSVWTINPTGDIGPEGKDILISGGDVGASDFQVCIFLSGNMYNFDYWYIDDVVMFEPESNDLVMNSIDIPAYAEAGNIDISCTIKNIGITSVNSFDVNYQVNDGSVITESVTGVNIETSDNYSHTFATSWEGTPGDYSLDVWVNNFNGGGDDDDTSNDMGTMNLSIATQSTQSMPFFESFTSSTCGPCGPFNSNVFNPFMEQHPDDITVLKYQMSWPAPGDPYYTEEGGIRRGYYGVSFVPDLYTGGNQTATNSGAVNNAYTTELNKPAFFEMSSSLSVAGDMVYADVNITPFISVAMKVHIAIVEVETLNNTGNNGESSFEHVMMKMLPDAEGTLVNFEAGTTTEIIESFDMSTSNVEEMDDLMVVVFIQDDTTKQVMQSTFSLGQPLSIGDNYFENVTMYPNPSKGSLYITSDRQLQVVIHDMLGKKVYGNEAVNSQILDLSYLENAIYVVTLSDGEKTTSKKLIINK
jgi:hypothetical protein